MAGLKQAKVVGSTTAVVSRTSYYAQRLVIMSSVGVYPVAASRCAGSQSVGFSSRASGRLSPAASRTAIGGGARLSTAHVPRTTSGEGSEPFAVVPLVFPPSSQGPGLAWASPLQELAPACSHMLGRLAMTDPGAFNCDLQERGRDESTNARASSSDVRGPA